MPLKSNYLLCLWIHILGKLPGDSLPLLRVVSPEGAQRGWRIRCRVSSVLRLMRGCCLSGPAHLGLTWRGLSIPAAWGLLSRANISRYRKWKPLASFFPVMLLRSLWLPRWLPWTVGTRSVEDGQRGWGEASASSEDRRVSWAFCRLIAKPKQLLGVDLWPAGNVPPYRPSFLPPLPSFTITLLELLPSWESPFKIFIIFIIYSTNTSWTVPMCQEGASCNYLWAILRGLKEECLVFVFNSQGCYDLVIRALKGPSICWTESGLLLGGVALTQSPGAWTKGGPIRLGKSGRISDTRRREKWQCLSMDWIRRGMRKMEN